jgi:CMP-N,N'-diacetyllegionaminic acid synthase
MRILAIIPARGGSKRLPGKNQALLNGLPLIAWTIRSAESSGVFDDIVVSTEDYRIAAIARMYGGKAPWLRPAELARDDSSAADVLLHAVKAWERDNGKVADAVCLLQPTSPFRRPDTLRKAVAQFELAGGLTVVGVSAAKDHPSWCMKLSKQGYLEPLHAEGLNLRSQDCPPIYAANGILYLVSRNHLLNHGSLYTNPMLASIIEDPIESIDIDTPFDWAVAERFAPQVSEEFFRTPRVRTGDLKG